MSLWDKIRGTIETLFQLGLNGPQLKNNSGVVELRNSTDSGFAVVRGADPTSNSDLTTKLYHDNNLFLSVDPTTVGTTVTETYTGQQLTNETWRRTSDSSIAKTIDYTYTGQLLTTVLTQVYATDGVTVLAATTDTLAYSGQTLSTVTRVRSP